MLKGKVSRGFTIIELMVVILIITVLASMMFVGFSQAQQRAKTMHCMNNLRMVGQAILTYANQKGGGYLPDFSIEGARVREQWVWELDFIDEDERYVSRQSIDSIIPPRLAPDLLRCPADVQLFVNSQSVLTSYWMHPANSYRLLSEITNADETILGFEGDAIYKTGGCGCRFHTMLAPVEVDHTHDGGGHFLFADGSVRFYDDPEKREREYWEKRVGLKSAR